MPHLSLLSAGEAVQVSLDSAFAAAQFHSLATDFFASFSADGQTRPDPGDKGADYRSFLGLPGGAQSPLFPVAEEARQALRPSMKLIAGSGGEKDKAGVVWVYDSAALPFHRGEQYHQFHSNFFGAGYDNWYVSCLWKAQKALGLIDPTGCPGGHHV